MRKGGAKMRTTSPFTPDFLRKRGSLVQQECKNRHDYAKKTKEMLFFKANSVYLQPIWTKKKKRR